MPPVPVNLQFDRQTSIDVPTSPVKGPPPMPQGHPLHNGTKDAEFTWKRINLEIDNFERETIAHHDATTHLGHRHSPNNGLDFDSTHVDANIPSGDHHFHPTLRGSDHVQEEPAEAETVPRRVFMEIDNLARHSTDENSILETTYDSKTETRHSSKEDEAKGSTHHRKIERDSQEKSEKLFDMNRYEEISEEYHPPRRVFMEMDNYQRQRSISEAESKPVIPESPLPTYGDAVKFPKYVKSMKEKVDFLVEHQVPPPPPYVEVKETHVHVKPEPAKRYFGPSEAAKDHAEIHILTKSNEIHVHDHEKSSSEPQPASRSTKIHPRKPRKPSFDAEEPSEKLWDMNRYEEIPENEGQTIKKSDGTEPKIRHKPSKSPEMTSPRDGARSPSGAGLVELREAAKSPSGAVLHGPVESKFYTIPQKSSPMTSPTKVYASKTMPEPQKPVYTPTQAHTPEVKSVNNREIHRTPRYVPPEAPRTPQQTPYPMIETWKVHKRPENRYEPVEDPVEALMRAQKATHQSRPRPEPTERPTKLSWQKEPEVVMIEDETMPFPMDVEKSAQVGVQRKSSAPTAPFEELGYPSEHERVKMPYRGDEAEPVPERVMKRGVSPSTIYKTMKSPEIGFIGLKSDPSARSPATAPYQTPWVVPTSRESAIKQDERIIESSYPKTPPCSIAGTPGDIGFRQALLKPNAVKEAIEHQILEQEQEQENEGSTPPQKAESETMLIQKAIAKAATMKRIEIRRKVYETPQAPSTPPSTPLPDAFVETDQGVVPRKMSRRLFKDLEKSMAAEYKKQLDDEKHFENDENLSYSRRETMESTSYSRRETMESHENTPRMEVFAKIEEPKEQHGKLHLDMPKRVPYLSESEEVNIGRERSPSPGLWTPYLGRKHEEKEEIHEPKVENVTFTR